MSRIILVSILISSFIACKAPEQAPKSKAKAPEAPVVKTPVKAPAVARQKKEDKIPAMFAPRPFSYKPVVIPKADDLKSSMERAHLKRQLPWRQKIECFGYQRIKLCLMDGKKEGQIVMGLDYPDMLFSADVLVMPELKTWTVRRALINVKQTEQEISIQCPELVVVLKPVDVKTLPKHWDLAMTEQTLKWQLSVIEDGKGYIQILDKALDYNNHEPIARRVEGETIGPWKKLNVVKSIPAFTKQIMQSRVLEAKFGEDTYTFAISTPYKAWRAGKALPPVSEKTLAKMERQLNAYRYSKRNGKHLDESFRVCNYLKTLKPDPSITSRALIKRPPNIHSK